MFTNSVGEPVNPSTFSRAFERIAERSGLPRIRLHDLRHSAVTATIDAGVPVDVVSRRIGHASTSITVDTYQHALPGQDRDAADKLAEALDA